MKPKPQRPVRPRIMWRHEETDYWLMQVLTVKGRSDSPVVVLDLSPASVAALVEGAAKGIYNKSFGNHAWRTATDRGKEEFRALARAAIASVHKSLASKPAKK